KSGAHEPSDGQPSTLANPPVESFQEAPSLTTALGKGRLLWVTPNRIVPARRAWSRLEERRDVVGRGLRRLDQLALVHALHLAVLLEHATGDEHPLDVLGLAVEDDLGDRPEHGGEVQRFRIDADDVRLLARGQG